MDRIAAEEAISSPSERVSVLAEGLSIYRRTTPSGIEAVVYDPLVCLILQGSKTVTLGERTYEVRAGQCVVVSHDLPVVARITEASAEAPYLALVAKLDLSELRHLQEEVGELPTEAEPEAYAVGGVDDWVLDVVTRYVGLADDPAARGVLTPLVRRELLFRLLTSSQGAMLRAMIQGDSHASRISQATLHIRRNYETPMEVGSLARGVGMSNSAFHRHFKQVTGTTPLQFQKDLRLTEARRLLRTGEHSVSTAAFAVGYESPTQFSREYARKFGVSPRHHRVPSLAAS